MTEQIELGRLIVQGPFTYRMIKEVSVTERMNEHGQMKVRLVLEESELEQDLERLEQSPVTLLTLDGTKVFCGICTDFGLERYSRYGELVITAMTYSHLADLTPNSRTFQSESKTLQEILNQVLPSYGALMSFEKNPPISQMIYQQNETDWAFAKRIANQFGLSLFVNGKALGFVVSVGTVPFSVQSQGSLPEEMTEKNISALRCLQQTSNPQLMAFEIEQKGGIITDLGMGVGHCLQSSNRILNIVESRIYSAFGLMNNQIKYTMPEGALPQQEVSNVSFGGSFQNESHSSPISGNTRVSPPSMHSTNVISGKVLEVSGSSVKVQFDADKDGSGGTRWIPYASGLSDSVYVMPDEGDTVFCYFENDGTIVCLGSKHADNSHPDFDNPNEKVLTSKTRMIKFKDDSLNITANRDEFDGKGGMQLTIILNDEEGIEISATKDIILAARNKLYIQAVEQELDNPSMSQNIADGQIELAQNFQKIEKEGSEYYNSNGGVVDGTSMTEAGVDVLLEFGGGIWDNLSSPFVWAINGIVSLGTGKKAPVDNKIHYEPVEDKQVMIFGLNCCILQVQESFIQIDSAFIYVQGNQIHQLGTYRGREYGRMEESTKSFMDNILDGVQLALDIVSIVGSLCPPLNVIASAVNAGISLGRGDYAGAAMNMMGCIPFGTSAKIAGKLIKAEKALATVLWLLEFYGKAKKFINKIQLYLGVFGAGKGFITFIQVVFSDASGQQKWDATYNMINGLKPYIMPAIKFGLKVRANINAKKMNAGSNANGTAQNGNLLSAKELKECGDPIDIVTGSQRMTHTDLVVKDLGGDFLLTRTYESIYQNEGGLLGNRWFLGIETCMWMEEEKAGFILPDMHLEYFNKIDSGWINERSGNSKYRLSELESGFILYIVQEKKQYQYDVTGKLILISDQNNNCIWLRYLGITLQCMEFSGGQVLNFTYEKGKISSITDVIGRKTCYRYDGELLTSVRLADEGTIQHLYTSEGYLSSVIDQNGNEYVKNEYDLSGRVTRQFLATGEEFVIFYDESNRKTTFQTVDKGDLTTYYYNKDGLVNKTLYPDGSTTEIRFDEHKNPIWEKDRNGGELQRVYDESGRVVEEILPNGLATWFAYDEADNLIREWNNNSKEKSYQYDTRSNCTEMKAALGDGRYSIYQYHHDSYGRMTELINPNGHKVSYNYENLSALPESVTFPNGDKVDYTYDRAGRCLSIRNDYGEHKFGYTNFDYISHVIDPLGNFTSWEYDRLGNLIRHLTPNEFQKATDDKIGMHYYYDAMDKQVSSIDSLGNVVATPRDIYGNIKKQINPNTYDRVKKDGEGIVYDYDVEDHLIRVHYPDGGIERTFYDYNGNIIKKVSPTSYNPDLDDGEGHCYTYDSVNRLVQITAPDGTVQKRYVYDLNGYIAKEIDAVGYLQGSDDDSRIGTDYCYNGVGWLTEKREAIKKEESKLFYRLTQYSYDKAGNMTEELRYQDFQDEISARGTVHRIRCSYDENNRLIQVNDGSGASIEYRYNSMNLCVLERRKISDKTAQIFRYTYDAAGRRIKIEQSVDKAGCGRNFSTTSYEYDNNGNILRIALPAGGEILRTYDEIDRLISETQRDKASRINNKMELCYDKASNLVEIKDNLGRKIFLEYDLMNQEIRRREKDGGIRLRCYDRDGRLVKLVHPNQYDPDTDDGFGYQYQYDLQGRLTTVLGPDGTTLEHHIYDESGRLLRQLDGMKGGAEFTYDLIGNRVRIQTMEGASQEFEYDARGNIIGVMDGNRNRIQYKLDSWGKISGVIKPDGTIEYYTYDYAGNMTSSTDGEGHTTQYEHNNAGKLSAVIDPAGGREEYCYDLENRLCQKTDRNGVKIEYRYNLYGAPLFTKVKGDDYGDFYEYTPEGLLKSAVSKGMRYTYEYDNMERLRRKSASGRTLLELEYDKNGNQISLSDITGKITKFKYNFLDLLTEIWDDGVKLSEYEYNPNGTIKEMVNGPIHQSYSYDLDMNLAALQVKSGEVLLTDNLYQYDSNGNCISKQQLQGNIQFSYDNLNQLVKAEYPTVTETLFYDRSGNRTRRMAAGVEELYSYDSRNHLISFTKNGSTTPFTYDNAGNLIQDNNAKYEYDGFNRTARVETFNGHVQINHYDAEGLRCEMEENDRLVQFIFHNHEVVTEQKEGGNVIRLVRGSELIAQNADYARTYYHYAADEMGSITHITDEEGQVVNQYEYDAWGNIIEQKESIPNRFKFTGQQLDPISQQYYLRARFYNPVIARFTQEDTYRGAGLNLYAYCNNNPLYYVDPSGNNPACVKLIAEKLIQAGISPEVAYRAAYREMIYGKLKDDSLSAKERYKLTDQLQRNNKYDYSQISDGDIVAIAKYLHDQQYGGKAYGWKNPLSVTIGSDGTVIVTQNNHIIGKNSKVWATIMFGDNVIIPEKGGKQYNNAAWYDDLGIPITTNEPKHAEPRGYQALLIASGVSGLAGARQATTLPSCPDCTQLRIDWNEYFGNTGQNPITNLTGDRADKKK